MPSGMVFGRREHRFCEQSGPTPLYNEVLVPRNGTKEAWGKQKKKKKS